MNNNAYYGFNPFWNFGSQNCAPQDWTFFNNYGWNTPGFGGNFNSGWNGSNSFGWNTPNFGWNTPGFGGNFGWNTPSFGGNFGWNSPSFGGNFGWNTPSFGWNGSTSFGWNTPNFGWNAPGFGGNFGNWNNGAAFSAPNWWGFANAPTQQSESFDANTNTNGYATSMWGTPEGQSTRDAA